MRPWTTCAVASAALAAASAPSSTAAPAPAPSAWTAPATVLQPPPRTYLNFPALAVGRGGGALAMWDYALANGHTGQRAARWRPDGTLGRSHDLSTYLATPLVYKRDRAFALVRPSDGRARRLRVVFGSTSGRFGAPRTIYTSPPDPAIAFARAAANERGDIAVLHHTVRRDETHRIVVLERPAGGRFGAPQFVRELAPCMCLYGPPVNAIAVALGPRGELAVAWQEGAAVYVRTRPAGGRLGAPVRLGRASEIATLQAAVSARGAIWVAWYDNPADHGTGTGSMTFRLAVRPAGAARFEPARVLDHVDHVWSGLGRGVGLALDPRGAGFVMWSAPGRRSGPRVRLASADPSGRSVRVRTLSAPGTEAYAGVLATSKRAGEALVVWGERYDEDDWRIQARLAGPGGALGPTDIISTSGRAGEAAAAFDPATGRATVLWAEQLPKPAPRSPSQSVLLAAQRGGAVEQTGVRIGQRTAEDAPTLP